MSQEGGEEAAGSSGRLLFLLIPLQVLNCTFDFHAKEFPCACAAEFLWVTLTLNSEFRI